MSDNNNNEQLYQLSESEVKQLLEAEEDSQKSAVKQRIMKRLNFIRSMTNMPINTSVGTKAIFNYFKIAQEKPRSSTFEIFRQMPRQHRDTLGAITTVVPIGAVAGGLTDNQFRRIVRDAINEQAEMLNEEFQPPAMLMLKRQAVRQFPDGQRVVLYTDNKYGLTFTVPYDARGRGFTSINFTGMPVRGMMAEETQHEIEQTVSILEFNDGETAILNEELLNALETVYESLNDKNKEVMEHMLSDNINSFNEVVKFVESLNENKFRTLIDTAANVMAKRSAVAQATKQNLPSRVTSTPDWQRSIAKDAANKAEDLRTIGRAAGLTAVGAAGTNEVKKKMKGSKK